ncbi:MAG TPA: homocysteine S-methyltransferase family protein [Candidatus Nanopelagicaceae bacterium]|nr:homocysteine S-methyltransferase family protein [Candidatus Nanopelagicaceae bacterium]
MLFHDWLNNSSKIILFDGGMGSEVFKRGILPGKLPDTLNIEQPDVIIDIHKSYYIAGADMCQSNTFGSSFINLKNYKIEDRIREINLGGLENIKKACPPNRLIAADIGPSGEFRPPVGKASPDQWISSFKKQVIILEDGVDLWHIETMSDIEEMKAALEAVRSISKKPIISSMTYKKMKKGFYTIMGDSLEKCVQFQEDQKVDVIGANCTLGSDQMVDLMKELKPLTDKPISIKPNAGQPRINSDNIAVYDQPIKDFVNDIGEMIQLGAKIVGGCCGTSPATIKKIRKLIDSLEN